MTLDTSPVTFNMFSLLRSLRQELRVQGLLSALPLTASQLETAKQAWTAPDQSDSAHVIRIDLAPGSKGNLVFFNNLEKDSKYKRYANRCAPSKRSYRLHALVGQVMCANC